ncbi:putative MFS-type transporter C19orf28 [Papilio machaon]|uniref:Putative MFS-type transporter C19orf28 n=1 Tax=Papilio machaon TaxID=76193 RepID=A0A194QRL4_PAPMA|nr:putative MFS-type transporter C19orf28 [Papilio machaon]
MIVNYGATTIKEPNIKENGISNDNELEISVPFKRRRWWNVDQKVVYGLGHVYNDLCAAMWFSYMMLYFQAVLEMRAAVAGAMLLLGQVVDALATPVVGVLADKYSTKKVWHLTGCMLVACTFPLLFVRCLGCNVSENLAYLSWWMPLYYGSLIVVFQIGWAIVQISHLAIIPSISDSLQVRSDLTSIRYMASVLSSLTVYFITWIVLRASNYSNFIGPADDYKFRDVSIIITCIGITTFTVFHIYFKNRSMKNRKDITASNGVNTSNGKQLNIEEGEPFQMPAVSQIFHFLQMPMLYQTRAGSSITLVSSLCVTADLIGPHSHQGASVYSIVTFADKLVTGIAVVAIENYKCDDVLNCPQYYRGVLTYACGGSALLGMISLSVTMFMSKCKVKA